MKIGGEIVILRYKTAGKCLRVYFGLDESDSLPEGYWEWKDAAGTYKKKTMRESLIGIYKQQVWGWCENKETIHIWVGKEAKFEDVVGLIAHERGHMIRPYHRSLKEEQKACRYQDVAVMAYEVARDLMKE